MKTWLLGIALASALPAQTLEGVVVDQLTGAPVLGVYVGTPRGLYGITDAGGRVRLDVPSASTEGWYLSISRSGYIQQQYSAIVSPGETITRARIELAPQAVISGTVEDEDGFPLRAAVSLLGNRLMYGRRQLSTIATASTNDRGEFRLARLVAGRYYLRIAPTRGVFYGADRYAEEYCPAGLREAEAKPIDVRAGQEITGLRMRFKPNRGFRVSGHIVLPPGYSPTTAIPVSLNRTFGVYTWFSSMVYVKPERDGSFTWRNIGPGDYELRVGSSISNGERGPLYARLPVHVDQSDLSGLELRCHMARPVDIPGKLSFAARTKPRAMSVILSGPSMKTARVNEDGTFVLKDVMPGSYAAEAREVARKGLECPVGVQSVRYAGREALGRRIDVDAPADGDTLEITVAEQSAELQVRALADPPDAASLSWIYVVNAEGNLVCSMVARGDLVRRLSLLPGAYRVFAARDSTYGQSVDDADFLAAHEKDMPVVRLQAGQNPVVELRVLSR